MEFKYPSNIFYLAPAIAVIFFLVLSFKKKEKIMAALHIEAKTRFKALRSILIFLGMGLAVLSLLGPQAFEGIIEVEKRGLDIYLLMDTSKSMLVSDIKADRMTVAKKIAGNLLNNLEGDRIGFIPFASSAYIQMPLTDDYELARMFLDVMDTDMISGGGTNLAAAIQLADNSFKRTTSADRVILIISDGEEHEAAGQEALSSINGDNLKIFTVGIGTEKGGLVPIYNDAGDTVIDYMRDESGNPATSRLNADVLKKLAQAGGGSYYQADLQGTETTALIGELSALKRDNYSAESIRRFKHLYQYFLAPGILLFMLGWFLPERRETV